MLQVRADAAAPQGYRTRLSALSDDPSWQWQYDLADDGSIELCLQEASAVGTDTLQKTVSHSVAARS